MTHVIKTYGARTKFDTDHLIICYHKLNYCSIEFIDTIFFQQQATFSFRKFYVKVKKIYDPLEIDIWKLNYSTTI